MMPGLEWERIRESLRAVLARLIRSRRGALVFEAAA